MDRRIAAVGTCTRSAAALGAGRGWEIVEHGEDDLGELSYRLIKYDAELIAVESEASGVNGEAEGPRGPGRPSRRNEIMRAFAAVAEGGIDPDQPMTQVFPAVRRQITGSDAPSPGLGDKTLRKTLAPLFETCQKLIRDAP
jgi:hypothetical protein